MLCQLKGKSTEMEDDAMPTNNEIAGTVYTVPDTKKYLAYCQALVLCHAKSKNTDIH
jgi:hypothetical protein